MELFLFSGQSNAGESPNPDNRKRNQSPFRDQCWYPNHLFKTERWIGSYADKIPRESDYDDFLPLADPVTTGVWPQTTFLFALESLNRWNGKCGPGYASRTDWFGGQPIESFLQGTAQFESTLLSARVLTRIAPKYNRTSRLGAFIFIQGETRGANDRESYARKLTRHFDTVRQSLAAQTNLEAPPVIYTQINQGSRWPKPGGVELAQLDLHRANGAPFFLAGPMYQFPLVVQGTAESPTVMHQNGIGKMMLGEMLAVAYAQIQRTGACDPLRPQAARRAGDTVTIDFSVPPGSRLAFDTDWITGVPSGKAGFVVCAQDRHIPIVEMRIANTHSVMLRIADAGLPGPLHIRYALDPQVVDFAGAQPGDSRFAPSTGRLMAQTDIASPFAARGYPLPDKIRHYCVRFELYVT
jgi:hypothetical protein